MRKEFKEMGSVPRKVVFLDADKQLNSNKWSSRKAKHHKSIRNGIIRAQYKQKITSESFQEEWFDQQEYNEEYFKDEYPTSQEGS